MKLNTTVHNVKQTVLISTVCFNLYYASFQNELRYSELREEELLRLKLKVRLNRELKQF